MFLNYIWWRFSYHFATNSHLVLLFVLIPSFAVFVSLFFKRVFFVSFLSQLGFCLHYCILCRLYINMWEELLLSLSLGPCPLPSTLIKKINPFLWSLPLHPPPSLCVSPWWFVYSTGSYPPRVSFPLGTVEYRFLKIVYVLCFFLLK